MAVLPGCRSAARARGSARRRAGRVPGGTRLRDSAAVAGVDAGSSAPRRRGGGAVPARHGCGSARRQRGAGPDAGAQGRLAVRLPRAGEERRGPGGFRTGRASRRPRWRCGSASRTSPPAPSTRPTRSGWPAGGTAAPTRTWQRRAEIVPQVTDVLEIGDTYAMGAWTLYELGRYAEAVEVSDVGLAVVTGRGANVELHVRSWRVAALHRLGAWDEAIEEFGRIAATAGRTAGRSAVLRDPRLRGAGHDPRGAWRPGPERPADGTPHAIGGASERTSLSVAPAIAHRPRETWRRLARSSVRPPGRCTPGTRTSPRPSCSRPARRGRGGRGCSRRCARTPPMPTRRPSLAFADRLEGRAALGRGDAEAAVPLLERAAVRFGELGAVWERAITEMDLASALSATRRGSDAAAAAAEAAATFERLGCVRDLTRARAPAAPAGERFGERRGVGVQFRATASGGRRWSSARICP